MNQSSKKEIGKEKKSAETSTQINFEFLSNISHEIRTPMNAILGFTELLMSQTTNEQHKDYLSSISSSGKSLLNILNDILDMSKIEAGKLEIHYEAVNPYTLLNEIKRIFTLKIRNKGLDFQITIDPDLPESLLLDEIRLRQTLLNLTSNAIKFTEKGYIKLTVHKKYITKDHSKLELVFTIQDTGIGISKEHKDYIFDAFQRQNRETSAEYSGVGLSLAITKRLVEMMGGEISLESEVGKGSTFAIRLKDVTVASKVKPADVISPISTINSESVTFENPSVLLVDDVEMNRSLVIAFLESHETNILEAKNGNEAVEFAKHYHPDIILMDMKMPGMDGYEATRIIKRTDDLKDIPVIGISAYAIEEDEIKCRKAGCDGYLKKPMTRNELISELKRFLPYTTEESVPVQSANETVSDQFIEEPDVLTQAVKDALPELLCILEDDCMVSFKKIQTSYIISEIETFAQKAGELGKKYNLDILANWGDDLLKQVKSLDIDRLPGTLNHFPVLVGKIAGLSRG
jgi:CheY-like chemotaxis protein/nitrogen-specific signal transduction histidine kinase